MKKNTKRLGHSFETIRPLNAQDFGQIQGGSITTGTSVISVGTSVISVGTSVISVGTSVISHR